MLAMILKFFAGRIGGYVAIGSVIALAGMAAALFITRATLDGAKRDLAKTTAAYQLEIAKHAVTRQSVATLEGVLEQKNAESLARAKAFDDARAKAEADLAALNGRYLAGETRRKALEGLAAKDSGARCPVPGGLLSGLEDL